MTAALAVTMSQQPAIAAKPDPYTPPKQAEQPAIKVAGVPAKGLPADTARQASARPAPVWPAASSADVTAGATGIPVTFGAAVAAPGAANARAAAVAPGKLHVQVLDQAASARAGVKGVVFKARRADGATTAAKTAVTVDYSKFATAYGADWSNRLKLVTLPDCALSTPDKAGCTATELPTRNDTKAKTASADVQVAAADQVMALTAAPSGSTGNFGATTLQPSGTWSSGSSSGNFSWSFPMRVPPAMGGPEPTVELAYSSQSVDGRMVSSNNQPSEIGEGFEMGGGGYIERRFKPCSDDTTNGNNSGTTYKDADDQCWVTDNATMSLGGSGGELIKDSSNDNLWHLRADDGSRIEHKTGADNGAKDGEWWVVTTPNGTQYWFGRNKLPGWTSGVTTNSAWTVPVFGNQANELCHGATFAASMCKRAWRWNLDYVVDAHGNTMSYWYDTFTNNYKSIGTGKVETYVRDGQVDHVVYGTRVEPNLATGKDTVFTGHGAARIDYTYADRCLSDCATHDAAHWPDTPWDLSCTSTTSCDARMPSFWTTKRLTTIKTSTYDALGGKFRDVEQWTLNHSFPDPGDGTRAGLWLTKVGHAGLVGGTTALPDVTFGGKDMDNRVDTVDNAPAMKWRRLSDINTETGSIIHIDYLDTDCVAGKSMPASPQANTMRCYPVRWTPAGYPEKTDYFNKYVVNEVTETDRTGGSPRVLHHYTYLGKPAWHYADDDGLISDDAKTWNSWRGYQKIGVTTGDPGEQTYTETTYFRGMYGDHLPSGTRPDTVPDSQNGSVPDEDAYSGMVRESRTLLSGPGGAEVSGAINDMWKSNATGSRTVAGATVYSRYVRTEGTHSRVTLDHAPYVQTTYTKSTFDKYGMVTREDDFGDEAVTGDEQCTQTTYEPRNTTDWILSLPHRAQTFAVGCATVDKGGLTEAQVIGDARTYYDAHTYGVAPGKGDITSVEQMTAYNSGSPTYKQISRTAYDALGRATESWDVLGKRSATAYTPATTGPVTQTVDTNPLGWTNTSVLEPAWGLATATVDINNLRTELGYDGLGRLTDVWQPGRKRTDTPDVSYDYLIRTDGVNAVTTSHLNPKGGVTKSYTLYDGLLRTRQTQTTSPSGGRILSDTFYDSAGRQTLSYGAYWDKTGTPGTNLVKPLIQQDVPNQTAFVYDGAGRVTASIFQPKSVEKWRTTTYYGGDHTDVTPPQGATGTSTWIDARGRTTQLRQYPTRSPTGTTYDHTDYAYNMKGQLTSVTAPDSSKWTYTYDLLGRQTGAVDPDAGISATEYDDAGKVIATKDGNDQWLNYTYDDLGRKTALWKGKTPTSSGQLAQWDYDGATFADGTTKVKGQLYQSSRIDGTKQYITATRVFDQNYQPTKNRITISTSETGIGGTYDYDTAYNIDGSVQAMTYPATADLFRETVRYDYTNNDQPYSLTNNYGTEAQSSLIADTQYDALAHALQYKLYTGLYSGVGDKAYISMETDQTTGRLNEISVHRDGKSPNTVTDQHYTYDDAGNVTKIADTPTGGGYSDIQCFIYDRYQRLQDAWTPNADDCATTPTNQTLGGPAPYWQTYTYTAGGARATLLDHNTANGDATTTYRFVDTTPTDPTTGQPHALRSTTRKDTVGSKTASYSYDKAGNTKTRPGPNGTQTLVWDAEGHLQSVTDTAGSTSYLYDADGNRLISRDATGKTLYLPNQEVRYNNSTAATSCTRYFDFSDATLAQRTSRGITWLASDHQGTQNVSIDEDTLTDTIRRQTPFGTTRGAAVTWENTKGFVGGTNDLTGLVHLGAREYDPSLGRFISVDPVFNSADPQSLEGYAYADNSPVVRSDPSGLIARDDAAPGGGGGYHKTPGDLDDDKPQHNDSPSDKPKKKGKCGWKCKAGKAWNKGTETWNKGANWVDDHKGVVAGAAVGLVVGIGCDALTGGTMVVACGAIAGGLAGAVEYSVDTLVDHKGNFSWGGMATSAATGAIVGGLTGGLSAIAGQGLKAGVRSLASGAGAKAAASAATAGVKKEASNVVSGLTKNGFGKSASKAAKGAADEAPGCHSFAASTLVLMADGRTKAISDVKVGDKVVAIDPVTGKRAKRTVLKVHVNFDTDLTDLTVVIAGRKAVVKTTQYHPFWDAANQRWVNAGDLSAGSLLRSESATSPQIASVTNYSGARTMFDLTVETNHTYFVVAGSISVLVHNCNGAALDLKYKDTWGPAERAAADEKVQALNDAAPLTVTKVVRSGSALRKWLKAGYAKVTGSDIDHTIDLQLGGLDDVSNMNPLDKSVNRSLGRQIQAQIKSLGLKPGDTVCSITISDRC
ncbi:polymorphic toxin-type HINT domain-containing protein [Actinoplanes sp. CA-131856]